MAFNDKSYGLFQGKVFIASRTMNGALTSGYRHVGDADMFTIDSKQKFEDINESMTGMGLTAAHIPTETSVSCKMRLLDINLDNFALAVWGTKTAAQPGGTVSGEPITLYAGSTAPLMHPGVSGVTIAGLSEGVDYTVDENLGAVNILPTSTATFPLTTTVSYTYAAYSGSVEAFTQNQPVFSVLMLGINTANSNQPVRVQAYQWAPDMAKTLNMIERKHMQFELDGMLLQDQSKPFPTSASPLSQFFTITKA
ncbi:MAG: phage tail tube protein [Xanthobacteraceae bacterium]